MMGVGYHHIGLGLEQDKTLTKAESKAHKYATWALMDHLLDPKLVNQKTTGVCSTVPEPKEKDTLKY